MLTSAMRRRIFRFLTWLGVAASLLIAAIGLASTRYQVRHAGTPFYFSGELANGSLTLSWLQKDPNGSRPGFGNPGWRFADAGKFGIAWKPRLRWSGWIHEIVIPLWMPLILTVFLTLAARRIAVVADPRCCARCGYCLSGLPAGACCPECGHERFFSRLRRRVQRVIVALAGTPAAQSRPG